MKTIMKLDDLKTIEQLTDFLSGTQAVAVTVIRDKDAAENKGVARKRMTSAQIAEAQKLSRELCAKIPKCVN